MSDYKLDIAFSGGDIRLTIIDGARWAAGSGLLVVGASVLGGSAVLLIQAVPPMLHGFP